ncbi:MAG: CPBP family intramembrane glutamic endopeptidase [Candidatus Micrarchaeia archaeon]
MEEEKLPLKTAILLLFLFAVVEIIFAYMNSTIGIMFYILMVFEFVVNSARKKELTSQLYLFLMMVAVMRILNTSMPLYLFAPLMQLVIVQTPLIAMSLYAFFKYKFPIHLFRIPLDKERWELAFMFGFCFSFLEYMALGSPPIIANTPSDLVALSLTMLLFVGFGEELLFRGLIQTVAEKLMGQINGLIFASVLFGIMHIVWKSPIEMAFATLAGYVFGLIYQRTRSLPLVVFAHAVNNIFWLGILPYALV